MFESEYTKIASYPNAAEAEQIRNMLEENGIPAFVDGAHANTAMSFVGSALGGVKVFAAICDESDAGKATMLSRLRCGRRGSVVGVPKLVAMKSTRSLISL